MRKLWAKQVFRDLVVINYGCEGLAENFYKTHEIVLMKLMSKLILVMTR